MLTIRDSQLHALGRLRTEEFCQRMVRYVATDFPGEYERLGDAAVRTRVAGIVAYGQDRRMATEGALAALVQVSIMFGDRFERSPDREWANEILSQVHVPDVLRMQLIRDRLSARTHGRGIFVFTPGVT